MLSAYGKDALADSGVWLPAACCVYDASGAVGFSAAAPFFLSSTDRSSPCASTAETGAGSFVGFACCTSAVADAAGAEGSDLVILISGCLACTKELCPTVMLGLSAADTASAVLEALLLRPSPATSAAVRPVLPASEVAAGAASVSAATDAALETVEELVFRVPEAAALFADFEAEEIDVKLIPRSSRSGTKIAVPAPGLEDLTVSQGLLGFRGACRFEAPTAEPILAFSFCTAPEAVPASASDSTK